jgi:hypothetical protein
MKLPHLTQHVLLDRGMARVVTYYLLAVQRELLCRNPDAKQLLSTAEALSLKPLSSLIRRVEKLSERDFSPAPKKPKPYLLRVEYDEMATVRLYYGRMLASAACTPENHTQLATVLGRFHQPSLNLETHIRLPAPTGPGCQTSWL